MTLYSLTLWPPEVQRSRRRPDFKRKGTRRPDVETETRYSNPGGAFPARLPRV